MDSRGASDVGQVNITVNPLNDPPSVSSATFSVAENSANGTVVGTVTASDPDAGTTLTYSLSGSDASPFLINGSGQITVNGSLNYEVKASYSFTVNVSDGTVTSSAPVTVNLTDVAGEAGPKITAVRVNGTTWNAGFRDFVDGIEGDGQAAGYLIPTGASQAAILPWINMNQILVTFNSNVGSSLDTSDFVLSGIPACEPT